jgi:hypothetical protein
MTDDTVFPLKVLSHEGIAAALEKAERYRLLNEPWQAESICRDILRAQAQHEQALVMLVLAISDQFRTEGAERMDEAREVVGQLKDEYKRAYYSGIVWERRATAQMTRYTSGAGHIAYDGLRRAMAFYDEAERIRPAGNDDALLRWNTCARLIMSHPQVRPLAQETATDQLE